MLMITICYWRPRPIHNYLVQIENSSYDDQIKTYYKPLSKNQPIVIVDIDDRSIKEVGSWPWNRKIFAKLVEKLNEKKIKALVFDALFSDISENPIDTILNNNYSEELKKQLIPLRNDLDFDDKFVKKLNPNNTCLAFVLTDYENELGKLPPPILTLDSALIDDYSFLKAKGYISNFDSLQSATNHAGFVNTTLDQDGILRFSPLVYRYGLDVFASLGLKAAQLYLSEPSAAIILNKTKDKIIPKLIQIGDRKIPVDSWGRILVPFRGPPFSFPYISAVDVLNDKVSLDQLQDKLVFIGSTAVSTGDFKTVAISSFMPGVEVHAAIASGIIDNYLPNRPIWGKNVAVITLTLIGLITIYVFQFLNEWKKFLFSLGVIFILAILNRVIWYVYGVSTAFFFSIPTVAFLFQIDFSIELLGYKPNKKNE